MANVTNTTLYTGVTNNLDRRVLEHKAGIGRGFSSQYRCTKLVWFEEYDRMSSAIEAEKMIKGKRRSWKNGLIEEINPNWKDLSS